MKLVPGPLAPIPPVGVTSTGGGMDRLPPSLPFSPELFWNFRNYGFGFPPSTVPPNSPLLDYKSQLPASLATDPRLWSREDVLAFLRWTEREFDLPPVDIDMFQMNGKAMCLLTRMDLSERAPGSGDVIYNVLQILVRDSNALQRLLPSSPVTPTSRHHPAAYPMSPQSHPSTPSWSIVDTFHSSPSIFAAHLMAAQSNSVTLSPAPSVESQNGSSPPTQSQPPPPSTGSSSSTSSNESSAPTLSIPSLTASQHVTAAALYNASLNGHHHHQHHRHNSGGSNSSDSDEDSTNNLGSHQHYVPGGGINKKDSVSVMKVETNGGLGATISKHRPAFLHTTSGSPPLTPSAFSLITPSTPTTTTSSSISSSSSPSVFFGHHQHSSAHPNHQTAPRSPKEHQQPPIASPNMFKGVSREFFPSNMVTTTASPSTNDSHEPNTNGRLLWDFLQQLLNDPAQRYTNYIAWKNHDTGVFKIVDPAGLAKLWGIQKNHLSMNYDKMSRALRYYYRVNILRKVQGERHCYQFLRNPTELKSIKNISMLRQLSPTTALSGGLKNVGLTSPQQHSASHHQLSIKAEPLEMGNGGPDIEMSSSSHAATSVIRHSPPASMAGISMSMIMTTAPPCGSGGGSSGEDEYDDKPTDLSISLVPMGVSSNDDSSTLADDLKPTDLSSTSSTRHVNIICSPDPPPIAYKD